VSHTGLVITVLLLTLMAVALVVVFSYGERAKKRLASEPPAALAALPPFTVAVSETNAAAAAGLSQEPIFMKQAADGLRVQLDNRPLVPIAMFSDPAAMAALREIGVRISQRYGGEWTAVVNVGADGSITVRRLT
jgi:hypothetical protein